MAIADADIAELATLLDKGRDDWIHGRLQWENDDSPMTQAGDATIFGPFGGVPPAGGAPKVRPEIQRKLVAQFTGGSGSTELVRTIVEGDLVVAVYIDRSSVCFADQTDEHPWCLRVTEVFRKQGQGWERVHRHADPLIRYRDLDTTRRLLD